MDCTGCNRCEVMISLEITARLNTQTKLFSSAPNLVSKTPNSNISEVCTGQPGALPVLNKAAIEKVLRFGCAVDATCEQTCRFERKLFFDPSLPRNFQLSSLSHPLFTNGTVRAIVDEQEKCFSITHVYLEEAVASIKNYPNFSVVDFNRAGAPLIRIISAPCLHHVKEVRAYFTAITAILEYIQISNTDCSEEPLVIDAFVSVLPEGEKKFRYKTGLHHLESLLSLEMSVEAEIKRQIEGYSVRSSPIDNIIPENLYWNSKTKMCEKRHQKESMIEMVCIPEPDLPPVLIPESLIQKILHSLPELPHQRLQRFIKHYGLSPSEAFFLTSNKIKADYFEQKRRCT